MGTKLREALARAEIELLLREVRKEPQGWVARQGCWLLRRLGRKLVAWGQRLERSGLAQDPLLGQESCTSCGA